MSGSDVDRVRLDKWLWAARFFKTRALATEAIEGGKVHVNDQRVKPARAVRVGDVLEVRRGFETMVVIVQALAEQRGPAKVAQTLYTETEASRLRRESAAEQRRLERMGMVPSEHRPSGRDRQKIRQLTGKD